MTFAAETVDRDAGADPAPPADTTPPVATDSGTLGFDISSPYGPPIDRMPRSHRMPSASAERRAFHRHSLTRPYSWG